jgi:hypothetical protein
MVSRRAQTEDRGSTELSRRRKVTSTERAGYFTAYVVSGNLDSLRYSLEKQLGDTRSVTEYDLVLWPSSRVRVYRISGSEAAPDYK